MYTGHFTVYRKKIIDRVGGFRSEYDFSQDYDLALRISEKTNNIFHIPEILYHWRTLPESGSAGGKPYARKTNISALKDAVKRRKYNAEVQEYPFANKINYFMKSDTLVSIIIPSDNKIHITEAIENIYKNTNDKKIEIIIVTNSNLINELTKKYSSVKKAKRLFM